MNFEIPWYVWIFFQSNLLELPIYALGLKRQGAAKIAFTATLANSITHPIVFFGVMSAGLPRLTAIGLAETWAVVGETAILFAILQKKEGISRIAIVSLLANLVSWEIAPRLTYRLFLSP